MANGFWLSRKNMGATFFIFLYMANRGRGLMSALMTVSCRAKPGHLAPCKSSCTGIP